MDVKIETNIWNPTTTFKLNSKSFFDYDREKMKEKFEQVLNGFLEEAPKKFIESRLSNTIKIFNIAITIERGYNVVFKPKDIENIKNSPYAHILLTITCDDYFGT